MKNVMINREKGIIYTAKVVSLIFTPLYLPLVGLIILFLFSYMNLLPLEYRLMVLTLVYFFTRLMPWRSACSFWGMRCQCRSGSDFFRPSSTFSTVTMGLMASSAPSTIML